MTGLEPQNTGVTIDHVTPETPSETEPLYCTQYQFSKMTGISKVSIKRHVDSGKIQLHERPDGRRLVFVPEAMNFYQDKLKKSDEVTETNTKSDEVSGLEPSKTKRNYQSEPLELTAKLATAEMEISYLKQMLESERQRREEAEIDKDRWHKAYEELKMLPAPPAPAQEATPQNPPVQRRSWWDRITGK